MSTMMLQLCYNKSMVDTKYWLPDGNLTLYVCTWILIWVMILRCLYVRYEGHERFSETRFKVRLKRGVICPDGGILFYFKVDVCMARREFVHMQ